MTLEEARTYAIGVASSAIVGLVVKWFGLKRSEETRTAVTWALEQGVAYAAQKFRDVRVTGELKQREALKVAESLAPKAMKRLAPEHKAVLSDSIYAKMKASLPQPSLHQTDPNDIPVDVVSFPPPTKVPKPS